MSILLEKKTNNFHFGIWKTNESISHLRKLSKNLDDSHLKLEKRKKEYLSTRILLNHMNPLLEITYNDKSAPIVNKNMHISISHCENLTSLILSKKPVGIDIQKINSKSKSISSKFINRHHLQDLSEEKACLLWTIKEAVFKWRRGDRINFKKDIVVLQFTLKNSGKTPVQFKHESVECNYLKIENQYLSYVCQ